MATVRNRTYKTTDSTIEWEIDGVQYVLDALHRPVWEYGPTLCRRVGNKVVFGYLVPDDNPSAPDEWDGEGKVLRHDRWHRNSEIDKALGISEGYPNLEPVAEKYLEEWVLAPERREEVLRWLRELGRPWNVLAEEWPALTDEELAEKYGEYDIADMAWRELNDRYNQPPSSESGPLYHEWYHFALEKWAEMRWAGEIGVKYALPLDVYEHGGIHVSIMDTRRYPDQQWDVSHGGGAWIPDQAAINNIDWPEYLAKDTPEEHQARALRYAQGCIETWNMYFEGDVYAHVVETHYFNEDGEYGDGTRIEDDTCWGHYGDKYAAEELQSAFDSEVASIE
jgi:hypothetical protein